MCTLLNMLQCVQHWTCYNVYSTEHVTMCTPLNMLQCAQHWTCYNVCTAEHVTMCAPLNMLQCVHRWTCYNVYAAEHVTMCTSLNMLQCVHRWTCYNVYTTEHVTMCTTLNMLQCVCHWTCYNVHNTEHVTMCTTLNMLQCVQHWTHSYKFKHLKMMQKLVKLQQCGLKLHKVTLFPTNTRMCAHTHTRAHFKMKFQFIHLNKWSTTTVPNITGTAHDASNGCGNTLQYTHNQYIMVHPHKCHACSMAYKLDAMFGQVRSFPLPVMYYVRILTLIKPTHMVAFH
jgi:hypothetical protein